MSASREAITSIGSVRVQAAASSMATLRGGGSPDHFARPTGPGPGVIADPGPVWNPDRTERMDPAAILTLLLIGGFVWGGLVVILILAVRKEGRKARDGRDG